MVIGIKDSLKLIGVVIVSACAVFVCALFLNYNIDLKLLGGEIVSVEARVLYDALLMTGKVVCGITGGCLVLTAVGLILFYINHYISTHKKELGILKALGYSDMHIAIGFASFGLSILLGTSLGFAGAFCLMPYFYNAQNTSEILPTVELNFHFELLFFLIIIPSLMFCMLSILFGYINLKSTAYDLLRDKPVKIKKIKETKRDLPFLSELKRKVLISRPSLLIFISFGGFCYSAMLQMSQSMEDYASKMMAVIMLLIGLILSFMSILLSFTSVIKSNSETIALMHSMGYSQKVCRKTVLGGYRYFAWLGFAVGTGYQYGLLKVMVNIVFKGVDDVVDYKFNLKAFLIAIITFGFIYELINFYFADRIKRNSLKKIIG